MSAETTEHRPQTAEQVPVPAGAGWLLLTLDAGAVLGVVVCADFHQPRFAASPVAKFVPSAQLKEAA